MQHEDIKDSISVNRGLLTEAAAVLRLIDHADEVDNITLKNAARAVRRLVETANDQLDDLNAEIGI